MNKAEGHAWVAARLAQWRAGLLADDEAERLRVHLGECAACRTLAEAFAGDSGLDAGAHLPPSLVAEWPRARELLSGLERSLVRRHLERCPECRQDLELLGHEPRLETAPALLPSEPRTATVIRVVRADPSEGRRRRERALFAWASLATAAAVVAIVIHVRRPVVEGVPAMMYTLSPPAAEIGVGEGGLSIRLAPRPRNLSGPAHSSEGGRVTVIPVIGPVPSLALAVRPLNVPDTAWVSVSLVSGNGDTLFTVHHRQWEFFPRRMLVIDGGDSPLQPGRYALILASLMTGQGALPRMSHYLFELRPRNP